MLESTLDISDSVAALRSALHATLPHFGLALRALPGPSGLRLWLIDDESAGKPIAPDEASRVAAAPPYWALCWAAGLVLADHLTENPEVVRGRTVVDLGAGSGVVAIAAARAGARRVYAADTDPLALAACRANAAANGVTLALTDDLDSIDERIDLMTLADVFYDSRNLGLIALARARAETILVGEARRPDLASFGLRPITSVRKKTLPDFGDPQFEQVRIFTG